MENRKYWSIWNLSELFFLRINIHLTIFILTSFCLVLKVRWSYVALRLATYAKQQKADLVFNFYRWTETFLRSLSLTLYWNEKYVGTMNPTSYSHIASSGHLSIADQLLQSLIPRLSSRKSTNDNSNSWQDLTVQNHWHLTKKWKVCLEWIWMYCKWSRIYHALKSRTTVCSAEGLDEARRTYTITWNCKHSQLIRKEAQQQWNVRLASQQLSQ